MIVGRPPITNCKVCDRHVDECGPLSLAYLCARCGSERWLENHSQLKAHSGPWFDHWRRRVAASVGALPLDDLDESG